MKLLLFLFLSGIVLIPESAFAQRRCDGGGNLTAYVSGSSDGPPPSAIAEVWVKGGVPKDIDPESVTGLREAIEAFERQRPSAESAAEIAAGDWTGWRAKLMSRDEFIQGFLDEVSRRVGTQAEYAAILQAAQAMRNRLDDLHGAAGGRDRPEDPHAMWLWDLHLRSPGAADEIARLYELPDGQWLWGRYKMGRRTAIACAFDDMSALTVLAATIDTTIFKQPDVVKALVAGRKVPLEFATMAYLSGLIEHHLPNCKWTSASRGLSSILRFQQATTQSALTNSFKMSNVVFDSIEFATNVNAGRADADALHEKYGCVSPVTLALQHGLVRTVQIEATVSSESLFVQSCSSQGLSLKQCACLAELGRGVAPRIEKMGYDRRTTIKSIVESNPFLGIQIGVQCGISDY